MLGTVGRRALQPDWRCWDRMQLFESGGMRGGGSERQVRGAAEQQCQRDTVDDGFQLAAEWGQLDHRQVDCYSRRRRKPLGMRDDRGAASNADYVPDDTSSNTSSNVAGDSMVRLQCHMWHWSGNSAGAVREQWRRASCPEPVPGQSSRYSATLRHEWSDSCSSEHHRRILEPKCSWLCRIRAERRHLAHSDLNRPPRNSKRWVPWLRAVPRA